MGGRVSRDPKPQVEAWLREKGRSVGHDMLGPDRHVEVDTAR